MAMITPERDLEESFVTKLRDLKCEYRPDIRDRATLEANFREKFEALIRVTQPGAEDRQAETPRQHDGLRLRLGLAAAQCAQAHGAARYWQDFRAGEEHYHLQPRADEHAAAWGEGLGSTTATR